MKKLFKALTGVTLALVIMLTLTSQAFAFVDYGTNSMGAQCHGESCNIVYSDDYSCIMDDGNYQPHASCKIVYARFAEVQKEREALIARIKLILSAR